MRELAASAAVEGQQDRVDRREDEEDEQQDRGRPEEDEEAAPVVLLARLGRATRERRGGREDRIADRRSSQGAVLLSCGEEVREARWASRAWFGTGCYSLSQAVFTWYSKPAQSTVDPAIAFCSSAPRSGLPAGRRSEPSNLTTLAPVTWAASRLTRSVG